MDKWPPIFTLDQERILNLLTGDRFYSNASAALREAILNAIDAVHRRSVMEPDHTGTITVTFNRQNRTLSVDDNGDGMDQTAVSELFTKVGSSAARLDGGRSMVGEFGIGVISYFMAGDSFCIQTFDGIKQPIGLRFTKAMLAGGAAEELAVTRATKGTTLEIDIRDTEIFELLLKAFPHWCRDVSGLIAYLQPENRQISQGNFSRPDALENLPTANWVERAHLCAASGLKSWVGMTGSSTISVLYRGIFVQEFTVRGLWGIEGSIDVDPKHFKPRLNREGFVEGPFAKEVEQFLREVHPRVLEALAVQLSEAMGRGDLDKWTARHWATLWLSVPRDGPYSGVAGKWDAIFRRFPAFELAVGNNWEPLSLEGILELEGELYVAPHPDEQMSDVVKAALRLLRLTKRNVIRGLRRDRGWLQHAGNYFATTADLITSVFAAELPKLTKIAPIAEKLLLDLQPVAPLYGGTSRVDIVKIGNESPPVLRLQSRLIINVDHPQGKAIVNDVVTENAGRWALIAITARHSHPHLSEVAAVVRESSAAYEPLGLVKRRFIKGLLS